MGFKCPDCGKELSTKRGRDSHRSQMHDWTRMVTAQCDLCEVEYERKRSLKDQFEHNFCSTDCQNEWQSEYRVGENASSWNGGKESRECEFCENLFDTFPSEDHKFCSKECATEARDYPTGEDHPRWNPDREWWAYYGPNWNDQRKKALDRDERCQICGFLNVAYKKIVGKNLDVHHIIPFEKFDDYEDANELNNLMAVCASCHNTIERGLQ